MTEAEKNDTAEAPELTTEEFVAEIMAEGDGEAETVETPVEEQPAEAEQTFEVQGEQITIDELKSGYMKGADYTQKTQELARAREEAESIKAAVNDFYEQPGSPEWQPEPPTPGTDGEMPEFVTPLEKELWEKNKAIEQKVESIAKYQEMQAKQSRVEAVNQTLDGFMSAHPDINEAKVVEISRTVRTRGMPYTKDSFELIAKAVAAPSLEEVKAAAVAEYKAEQKAIEERGKNAALEPGTAPAHTDAPPDINSLSEAEVDALMAEEFRRQGG